MVDLSKLEVDLINLIEKNRSPILAWSGGKDSTFLLMYLKKLGYNIDVLVFPHFWSNHQKIFIKKMVSKYKIKSFFFRPTSVNFDGQSIISRYSLGVNEIPVLIDVIDGLECGLERGRKAVEGVIPHFLWDKVILGTKLSDTHRLVDKYDFSAYSNIDCPLWDWTDEEVLDYTKLLGFPYDERVYDDRDESADTGNFSGCMKCIGVEEVFCPKVGKIIKGV